MNIKDFTDYLNKSTDIRDFHISKAMSLLMTYYNKYKNHVPKEDKTDLFMDLVCEAYSVYDQWEGEGYNEFCSHLYFKLMVWQTKLLTKYHGIKVSRNDLRKSKKDGVPIILTKVEYDEGGGI